jgi:signal transduction histidine kinase
MSLIFNGIASFGFVLAGILAVYGLAREQWSRLGWLFFVYTGITAALNLFVFLGNIASSDPQALFCFRLAAASFILLLAALSHFFIALAERKGPLVRPLFYLPVLYLPVLIISWIAIATPWFYTGVEPAPWGYNVILGPLYRLSTLYGIMYVIVNVLVFRRIWNAATNEREKKQLAVFRVGMFASWGFAIMFEVVLSLLGARFFSMIPATCVIYSVIFAYAFVRFGPLVISPLSLAQNIVETMPEFLLFANSHGKVELVNDHYLAACGYSRAEVLGKPFNDLASVTELWLRKKNGDKIPVALAHSLVKDWFGEEIGMIYIFQDVSEQRRVEKMKDEFLSMISHELRTPLSIIKEGVDGILDQLVGPVTPEQQKYLTTVKNNIDRLARIVNQTLDISRIEAGKLIARPAALDLREIVNEAVERFGGKAKEKEIELGALLINRPITAYADPDMLRQVLDNLLGNALKFTGNGGRISVDAAKKGKEIAVSVVDNGMGMTKEDQSRIFKRFVQLVRIPGAGEKGTGLGLVIVKSLVEAQGGRIWVESEPGKGSKFTFTIPQAQGA